MQLIAEIDTNGRILIPADIRKFYNWNKGTKLVFKKSTKTTLILTTKKEKVGMALAKFQKNIKNSKPGVKDFLQFRKNDLEK